MAHICQQKRVSDDEPQTWPLCPRKVVEVGVPILSFLRSLSGCKEFCNFQTSALKGCILSPLGIPPGQGSLGTVETLEGFWKGAVETLFSAGLACWGCQLSLCDAPSPVPRSNVVSALGVSDALGGPLSAGCAERQQRPTIRANEMVKGAETTRTGVSRPG